MSSIKILGIVKNATIVTPRCSSGGSSLLAGGILIQMRLVGT